MRADSVPGTILSRAAEPWEFKDIRKKLPGLDSNQDKESQNLLCYRYTTG